MNVLIAFAHPSELEDFFKHIGYDTVGDEYKYKHIHLDFVQTGYTVYETAFAMGQSLGRKNYHLILYAGLANSLNDKMKTGDVLNVINDIPFAIGRKDENGFEHAYTLGWLNKQEKPHVRGGYINMTNAYFNVFMPFMKTAALTASTLEGDESLLKLKMERFPIHIESSNGIAFHFACLKVGSPFYQLRAVGQNLYDKSSDKSLAIKELNSSLNQIIDLL